MNDTEEHPNRSLELTRLLKATQNGFIALPCLAGSLIVLVNSAQLWFLQTKFRREINPLFVIIRHLCIADLSTGIMSLVRQTLLILEWKVFTGNVVIDEMIYFTGMAYGKFTFVVSTITLDYLTVMKMLKVTRNYWLRKITCAKICRSIWGGAIIVSLVYYASVKADVFPVKAWPVIQGLWFSILAFPSIILQLFCYGRIFFVTRANTRRNPGRADGSTRSDGSFLKISVFQVAAFIVCELPLSTYLLILNLGNVGVEDRLVFVFVFFITLHSLVDPLIFFVVYRGKLRKQRPKMAAIYNGRSAFVIHGSHLQALELQANIRSRK